MKKINLFSILVCMLSMLLLNSCENADILNLNAKIESRDHCVEECADCPIEDCCCSIELTSQNSINLVFCGVTDPCLSTMACGPTEAGSCTISGYELYTTLSPANPQELFCVGKNSAFYITSSGPATARMTCQYGQTNPQTVSLTFNTPPGSNKVYYSVDGSCELTSCF